MALLRWGGVALSLLAALALIPAGLSRFRDGLAMDAAIPVPASMIAHLPVPMPAYRSAAASLGDANSRNSDAHEARGEALLHLGNAAQAGREMEEAIAQSPASARAWVVFAETQQSINRQYAAQLNSQALLLAPFDFSLVWQRLQDSSSLWDQLNPDGRRRALDQVKLLWSEPLLHPQLLMLLSSTEGRALATRAFADDSEGLRAMNRWVSYVSRRNKVPAGL